MGWVPLTFLKSIQIARKEKIDLIYVSCSPFSSGLIGVWLKHFTKKPLVLDFRDPLALETCLSSTFPLFRRKLNSSIEKYLFRNMDALIVSSDEIRHGYQMLYPELRHKIVTVHNGFDAEFIGQVENRKFQKFTIVYTGDFYSYSLTSEMFFKALHILKDEHVIYNDNFQFLYYGESWKEIVKSSLKYELEDLVGASPRVKYVDMLSILTRSHMELLRIIKPMISTKLFEGIALNIPFLATIPSGEVEAIIRKYSPSSYIITDDSPEHIAESISDCMKLYAMDRIQDNRVSEFLNEFSREKLALKAMSIFEGLTAQC